MSQNPKLLIAFGGIAIAIIVGFFWMRHGPSKADNGKQTKSHAIFDKGAGDTNNEVLKTLIAMQAKQGEQLKQLATENEALRHSHDAGLKKAMSQKTQKLEQQIVQLAQRLKVQGKKVIDHYGSGGHNANLEHDQGGYQIGGRSNHDASTGSSGNVIGEVGDIAPAKSTPKMRRESTQVNSANSAPDLPSNHMALNGSKARKKPIAFYTIPDGSTIANTVLLSPLIGEVPVNKSLVAPAFPFKAIIGYRETQNMFTANNIPLPTGIAGTVLQGVSVGNMALACTRAYITKILFVFTDGHFEVYPTKSNGNSNVTSIYPNNTLGYLSDRYNNPCISDPQNGKYITDAPKVIGTMAAFSAGAGVGGAIADAQKTTVSSATSGATNSFFTGNLGNYAAGVAIGEASKAALKWYSDRVSNIFDAVFIPSTTSDGKPRTLIFNVTQSINIDLNQLGRTLNAKTSHFNAADTAIN